MSDHRIQCTINGRTHLATVESRLTLSDFLRVDAGYTGVHIGCEHGVCGACTVLVDGAAVRACLMLAVQADGTTITTVEGLAAGDGKLHPIQQALKDAHGLQCGFCTPGIVMTLAELNAESAKPSVETMTSAMSGHLCRCTGYQGIRRAIATLAGEASKPVAGDHA
jgi:carbon-monoxide dehydrogenase small subunit